MKRPRAPIVAARKAPRQIRSSRVVEAILQAAIHILERDGAAHFTTIKVAKRAGISIGSLYQYFPNKESILFRLQTDEWARTERMLDDILTDNQRPAAERLRRTIRAFFRSELDEAPLRQALGEVAPLYRDTPEAAAHRARALPILLVLLDEAQPGLPTAQRNFAAELFIAILAGLGKYASEVTRAHAEIDDWAEAAAEMFLAYLRTLGGKERRGIRVR